MTNERDYVLDLGDGSRMRVEFAAGRSKVQRFVVQLEQEAEEHWRPAVRYDTSHGDPHRDTMDRRGRQVGKDWLPVDWTLNRALTFAEDDIKRNWRVYQDRYWER